MDVTLAKEKGGLILGLFVSCQWVLICCGEKVTSSLFWLPCWPSGQCRNWVSCVGQDCLVPNTSAGEMHSSGYSSNPHQVARSPPGGTGSRKQGDGWTVKLGIGLILGHLEPAAQLVFLQLRHSLVQSHGLCRAKLVQLHEAEGMSKQLAAGTGQTPYLCNICLAIHWHLSMVFALRWAVSG